MKLVISDAHTSLKGAIARVFGATPRGQHTVVAAAIRQAFSQPDQDGAAQAWRHVADHLRRRWPKLAELMRRSTPSAPLLFSA